MMSHLSDAWAPHTQHNKILHFVLYREDKSESQPGEHTDTAIRKIFIRIDVTDTDIMIKVRLAVTTHLNFQIAEILKKLMTEAFSSTS